MAACRSWITSPVAKCLVAEVFFCSHTVLPKEHRLGVIFFLPRPSSCYAVLFLSIPCLPVRSTPLSYMYVCMYGQLDGNFTGTCD